MKFFCGVWLWGVLELRVVVEGRQREIAVATTLYVVCCMFFFFDKSSCLKKIDITCTHQFLFPFPSGALTYLLFSSLQEHNNHLILNDDMMMMINCPFQRVALKLSSSCIAREKRKKKKLPSSSSRCQMFKLSLTDSRYR